jgi:hypothetical protein
MLYPRMAEGPPAIIQDLADACVRFVHRALGIELDYTSDTLPLLDHYLRGAHGVAREEVLKLVVPAAGAYFGEVVRRQLGEANWYLISDQFSDARLEFEQYFLSFNPLGMALEAVTNGEAEGYGAHLELARDERAMVHEAVERAGDVGSEDYYRLAVRYEVLELVTSLLADKAAQSLEPRRFGPEAYAALREAKSAGELN